MWPQFIWKKDKVSEWGEEIKKYRGNISYQDPQINF